MNESGRNKLKRVVQNYDRSMRQSQFSFINEIESLKDEEECKRGNLPYSFEYSTKAYELDEAVEKLKTILKKTEKIEKLLDDIIFEADVTSDFRPAGKKTEINIGKKDARFLILLPSSMLKRLKEEASCSGLSMNEIVCRAIMKELSD
jgi:predicted DNA binding CopG/RHH family protein